MAAVFSDNLARNRLQANCTRIISQRYPCRNDVCCWRCCQIRECGEERKKLQVFWQHALYLCLLEHNLRHKDRVWVAGRAPGQSALLSSVPFQKKNMHL